MSSGEAASRDRDQDWLFDPAVDSNQREPWDEGPKPWRVGSQLYVAFFGGALAVTAIAFLNARRLGVEGWRRGAMVLLGAVALVGVGITAAWLTGGERLAGRTTDVRLIGRGIALVLFLVLAALQKTRDRVYSLRNDEYASLWGAGLLAVFVGGGIQAVIVLVVANAL